MRRLIHDCHESPKAKKAHTRRAWQLFRSLVEHKIIEFIPKTEQGASLRVNATLQDDFSMDHELSLYLLETIPLMDPQQPDYALVLLTLVESILEDPDIILRKQLDKLKTQKMAEMKLEGLDFGPTLAEAQRLGYAEADPSLDVDGFDSEHKIGILASLAHGFWVAPKDIYVEGIRAVTREDIAFAGKLGYTIKLLGVVKAAPGARRKAIQVSVYPALIPNSHVLASVNYVFNAIFCRGDVVGDTLFYGRGAGKDATASAVLSDIADAALDLTHGTQGRLPPFVPHDQLGVVLPIAEVVSRYYLRFNVADKPGALARIASILAAHKIGISSVIQPEGHEGESVPLILMSHEAPDAAVQKALAKIARLQRRQHAAGPRGQFCPRHRRRF